MHRSYSHAQLTFELHTTNDVGAVSAQTLLDFTCRELAFPCRSRRGGKSLHAVPGIQQLKAGPDTQHKRCTNADSAFDCFSRALKALQVSHVLGSDSCCMKAKVNVSQRHHVLQT